MDTKEKKLCTAHKHGMIPCNKPPVKGKNVCNTHGAKAGRPPSTFENIGTGQLKQRIKDFENSPEIRNEEYGIQASLAALSLLVEKVETMDKESLDLDKVIKAVEAMNNCANSIYNGKKAIAAVEHSNVLTAKEYMAFSEGILTTFKALEERYPGSGEYMLQCFERFTILKTSKEIS